MPKSAWRNLPQPAPELNISSSSVVPSARDFRLWLLQPFEHTKTLYLVDIREAKPVAVFKLHIFFLLLVIAVAVGVELQPGGHRQVVGNAGNPRPRSVPLNRLSHQCPPQCEFEDGRQQRTTYRWT